MEVIAIKLGRNESLNLIKRLSFYIAFQKQ